jgi:signal transduction histidine kinase
MEERVKLLDGQIEIVSSRGHGTEVRVEIPVPSTVSS